MNKEISIVITVYNKEIYLGHCFTLLNEQLLKIKEVDRNKIELLIINDCSTDGSIDLISSILDPRIERRIINNDRRRGIAYVRWQAVNEVKGKYFIFIDADDLLSENYIETILGLDLNGNVDMFRFKGREYPNGILMDYDTTWMPTKMFRVEFIRKNNINFDKDMEPTKNDEGDEAVIAEDIGFYEDVIKNKPIIKDIDKILLTWNFAVPDSLTKINYSYLNFISEP